MKPLIQYIQEGKLKEWPKDKPIVCDRAIKELARDAEITRDMARYALQYADQEIQRMATSSPDTWQDTYERELPREFEKYFSGWLGNVRGKPDSIGFADDMENLRPFWLGEKVCNLLDYMLKLRKY